MAKIDSKLIDDYINGNDINDIDELENNVEFMKSVIDKTNDKNFYNLCSDELKVNYEFIIYLVNKYIDDKEFICKITDYCLVNNVSEDPFVRMELAVLVSNSVEEVTAYRYKKFLELLYKCSRIEIEALKASDNDLKHTNFVGMGFIIFFDSCHGNEMLLNYIASSMISDIFDENEIDLEGLLHKHFKSLDEFEKMGINNFLINFIESFDSMLSSYLSTHLSLLSSYVSRVDKIKKKWNRYNEVTEMRKYNRIIDKIYEYIYDSRDITSLEEEEVLFYVGKKYGILDELIKYNDCNIIEGDKDTEVESGYVIYTDELEKEINRSFGNKMIVENACKIVERELYPSRPTEEEIEMSKHGGKAIKFELNKKVN